MPNRLKDETSPYLRQHADNPVDWYPFGDEAFARARELDRPVLLSIGYSACHWCHVMAHESFEDEATAAQMNRDFINIKVDREEHPEVDQLYQHALQLFGEHGGWPLTMFLLPTGEPFYGGTYFPPDDRYGRTSFKRVLHAIAAAYREDNRDVRAQADKVRQSLTALEQRGGGPGGEGEDSVLPSEVAMRVAARLATRIDLQKGGFKGAPKFPNPSALDLFFRAFAQGRPLRAPDPELVEPVLLTLRKMAEGGIYDHLGGGFARYSTDVDWLVPHFEKMLYDNAQLLRLYAQGQAVALELGRAELAAQFATVITETHGWLERELRDVSGGLYAAQDADSEGVEGKYFVWTPDEVAAVLGKETAAVFCRIYDVTREGNWNDPHGHGPQHASILHPIARPADARERQLIAEARVQLLAARQRRVPPGTDDKILTGWNGLMVSGLAEAGRLLGEPKLIAAAVRTVEFLQSKLRGPDGALLRTYKNGLAKLPATLDDHAFLAEGCIYLASATGSARYLRLAVELCDAAIAAFFDAAAGLFYLGPTETAGVALVTRPVSRFDGAIPSGMSVMCMNLLRLAALNDARRARYQAIAEQVLRKHGESALGNPFGMSNLLAALDLLQHGLTTTVILDPAASPDGGAGSPEAHALVSAAAARYVPDHLVLVCHPERPLPAGFDGLREGKTARSGKATAYVCRGPRCTAPITDAAQLVQALSGAGL